MPRGPKGEKRPADVIGAAIMVAKIATAKSKIRPLPFPIANGGLTKRPLQKFQN